MQIRLPGLVKVLFPFPLGPLFLLVGIFYANIVSRITLAPLLPVVKADLGLGLTGAGSLFFLMALGYCSGLFMSGFVTARLNHRRTILLSAGTMGAAMISLSQVASLAGIYASLVAAGLSAGLYIPSGVATVTNLVSQEHWGRAIAIHELAPNLGFVTAPFLAEGLLRLFSWRGVLGVLGIVSIFTGGLYLLMGRKEAHRGEAPRLVSLRSTIKCPGFWMITTYFIFAIGASTGVYSMMPLFLISTQHMSRESANVIVGLSRVAGFLLLFFYGWIADRAGQKMAVVFFLAVTGMCILFLGFIRNPAVNSSLVFLQAASAACMFPAAFVMLSSAFPPNLRSLAVSLAMASGFLVGGGVFPLGIGYIAERLSFSWSFSLVGILTLGMVPVFWRRDYLIVAETDMGNPLFKSSEDD